MHRRTPEQRNEDHRINPPDMTDFCNLRHTKFRELVLPAKVGKGIGPGPEADGLRAEACGQNRLDAVEFGLVGRRFVLHAWARLNSRV